MVVTFSLRPGTSEDLDFLFYLKINTIKDYVTQVWGWEEEFQATRHRQTVNPESYRIIQVLLGGEENEYSESWMGIY